MASPRFRLTRAQTHALVSLLCTIGQYVDSDLRQESGGALVITVYWKAYSAPVVWRIAVDGETHEIAEVPA